MKYSTLIWANGKSHYEIVKQIVCKETEANTDRSDLQIAVYMPDNAKLDAAIAREVKPLLTSKVRFTDILNIILNYNTIKYSELFTVPDDLVIIIPHAERFTRFVGVELLQSVLYQLVYMGVRMYFITDGGCPADELEYEEVIKDN